MASTKFFSISWGTKAWMVPAKHADWAKEILANHGPFAPGEAWPVVQEETGKVFARVLEHAGVFKRDAEGHAAFLRFLSSLS